MLPNICDLINTYNKTQTIVCILWYLKVNAFSKKLDFKMWLSLVEINILDLLYIHMVLFR